ncbi:MAG: acyl-CoA thioesterase [Lentimicrobiaceae bacterium]|nr:acyl-CoA thioesterase [Lentimicrobiaceae bacterium]
MPHLTSIQIRLSDLDSFGHVNNGAQCHLFDFARMNYFETVLKTKIDWTNFDLVLVNITLDFRQQIRLHDNMICQTEIYEMGSRSMKMRQHLVDANTEVIKSTCHSTLVAIDREKNCSKEVPENYKRLIAVGE